QAAADSTQRSPIAGYVEQAAFTSLDGDTVQVSDFKGKVVMIDLWETWCAPCIESFPTLQKLQEEYSDDFVMLAVTPGFSDTRKDAKAFADEHDYSFRFLMDSNELYKKIKVQNIPYKLFIDAEGNFIKKSLGSYGPKQDYKKIRKIIEEHGCKRHRCTRIVSFTAVLIGYLLLAISGCSTVENSSESVEPVKGIFAFKRAVEQAAFTNFEGDTVSVTDFRGK